MQTSISDLISGSQLPSPNEKKKITGVRKSVSLITNSYYYFYNGPVLKS